MKVRVCIEMTAYQACDVEIPDGTPDEEVHQAVIDADKWTNVGLPEADTTSGEWLAISRTDDKGRVGDDIWHREI